MRLFVGLDLPLLHLDWLESVTQKLRCQPALENLRWQSRDQLHITLRFLGECRDDQASAILAAIKETAGSFRSFRMSLGKVRNMGGARGGVLVAAIEEGASELKAIGEHLQLRLSAIGFPAESRVFQGHVTLARTRGRDRLPRLPQQPPQDPSPEAYVDKLVLFQSKLSPGGSEYLRLSAIPLT